MAYYEILSNYSSHICYIVILVAISVVYVFFTVDETFWNEANKILIDKKSSVWCQPTQNSIKKCTFRNLCYNGNNNFIFVLNNESVISGLDDKLDLQHIKASSVLGYNGSLLKIYIVTANNPVVAKISYIDRALFLLWRFKPDNIMHVIHDDLLPLFATYNELCEGDILACLSKYQLAFIDNNEPGPYYNWYKSFSKSDPIFLSNMSNSKTICFETVKVGLLTNTMFYQYGFGLPQGPVAFNSSPLMIKMFSDFVLTKNKVIKKSDSPNGKCTLISRKINRKLLNNDFLMEELQQIYKSKFNNANLIIEEVDLSTNSSEQLLTAIKSSKLLIGMHGAAMMLAMFLPDRASVVELFPFGINGEIVSPLMSLSKTVGIHFRYLSWHNTKEKNTVVHPEYFPLLGGINHLDKLQQEKIKMSKSVPAVRCCHNPLYLYRMYQDTVVDDSIIPVLKESLLSFTNIVEGDGTGHWFKKWYFPGAVSNVTCTFDDLFVTISWDPPINVQEGNAKYLISLLNDDSNISFETDDIKVTINMYISNGDKLNIWVLCDVDGIRSGDTYAACFNN